MKKKLLLLAAVSLSWLGASAQWVKPEVKSLAPNDVADQGMLVRIYNVEYGAFLGGANAWGTQTSLLEEGLDYKLEWSDDGLNYKLKTSSGGKAGKYMFRDNVTSCFIDMGTQYRGFNWTISQTESGFYTIQSPLDDPQYGTDNYEDAADMFFGWNGDKNIVYANVRVEDFDEEGNQKPCGIEWAFMTQDDAAALVEALKPYNAAVALKKVIDQAKADYPTIDCSKAEAVYNNTNSTVEELKAAERLVANAIAAVHTAEVLKGASEDDPVDGTELIVNADFSTGDINGWECTFQSGTTATNVGYQGAYYNGLLWEDEETGESGQAFFDRFIEAWANNVNEMKRDGKSFATIGDAKLCQTIYGMPAGKYKLSADVNAVQQWVRAQNPVTGVELYVLGGDIDSHVSMATDDGVPEHFILTFIHTGGDLELGLRTKSTTANWIGADNFTLKYYGPISKNPYQIVLETYVELLEKQYTIESVIANTDVKQAYSQALQQAGAAKDGQDDEYYKSLRSDLEDAETALKASIRLYESIVPVIASAKGRVQEVAKVYGELASQINTKIAEWESELESGTLGDGAVADISAELSRMISDYVNEHVQAGDDITFLLTNANFKNDFSGWDVTGIPPVWAGNHDQGANMSEYASKCNQDAVPDVEDGLAERWHGDFTMSQTIKSMPRGIYQLSCQGFNRVEGSGNPAELYAVLPDGSVQTAAFCDIAAYQTATSLYQLEKASDAWPSDRPNDNGKYEPNGMTGAAWHFMHKNDGENLDYTNKFNIVLTEKGDITLGARCDNDQQWVIFDNFKITYLGSVKEDIHDWLANQDKYLQNADFGQGDVMDNGICTYQKDMASNGTVYYSQQEIPGWQALSVSTDAVASGIFAVNDANDDNIFLGGKGYLAPTENPNVTGNGRFLGLVAVWLGTAQYTQPVTLPAGCYKLTFPTYNGGGTGAVARNLFGFIADNGTQYTCDESSWGNSEWKDMSVTFILEEETSGVISLGYASANAGSGSMPHLFIDGVKITEGNPNVVLRPQIEAAKEELIALLQDGDELGTDTREGWSVYNDDNASLEQVQQAIAQQKENNAKGMTDLTDFFINNAHFAEGDPVDGGISTYDYDMPVNGSSRFGMQPVEKWIASSPSDNVQRMEDSSSRPENPLNSRASGLFAVGSGENVWLGSVGDVAPATKANGATEGNVFGFISVWNGTAYYSQHVTLPAGNYTITIPTYNERGTGAIAKNMCGFIADNGQEYLAKSTTFPVSQWTNETIKFTLDEETPGVIAIGYVAANAGSGSMPHLFVDEFLLRYNGVLDVSPSLLALQGAVRTAESYTDDDLIYEAALKNTLKADVEKGKDLVAAGSTDDDVNVKTATDINNGIVNARSSMAAYEEFHAFLEDCSDLISTYDESSRVGIRLNNLLLTYEEGYNNRTYGNHEIRVIIDGFDAKVQEIIQEVADNPIDPGTDVSDWLVNPSFADGFNGWTNSQGSTPIGNVGGLTFCPDVEVFENVVDIQQIVTDAPDGIYSLECQAFERPASNGYFTGEEESNVFLYLNEFQTPVQHIVKDAMPADKASDMENCYIGNGGGSWPYDYYVEGYGWIPNSVDGASYAFAATPKRYVQKAYGLVEGGQMKVGLTSNGRRAHWVLWANFKLIFEGKTVKSLTALLNTSMQKCEDIRDRHQFSWPVDENLYDAYDKAEGALYSNDVNYMWDALIALNNQINEAQKNATLLQDFQNELDSNDMYQIREMIEEMDDADLWDEYNEIFSIDPYDCTNEEIQNTIGYIRDFISRVRYAYNVYLAEQRYEDILAAVDGASDANPVDITWGALVNPDLEEGNTNGWTLDLQTYTNKGYQGMSYYGDLTEVDDEEYEPFCANFIEVWCSDYNNPILGDIYQTVKLPAGTYRLGADMIASYQGGSDPVHGCFLVANDTHLEAGTANGVPQHFELYFKLTKPAVVKLGINCTSSTNANWLAADNFTLTAYGTNSNKDANGEKIDEGKTLQLDLAEGWNWVSVNKYDLNNANVFNDFLYGTPEMNYVASQTQNIIWDEYQGGWFGDLQSIAPGLGYKMKLSGDVEVELTGDNCSARYTNITLNQGWNWIGYTPVKAQKPNAAMAQFYPEEGDMVKAKDGFIIFQHGAWTENITMQPGQGYLYYSNANGSKNVKFDDQEQLDNNGRNAIRGVHSESLFDIDVHRYANNMAIVAQVDALNADDMEVYAFAGEECRGKSAQAAGLQLVTVQGDKNGEEIGFIIYNKVSGEMFQANESVKYNGSKMGTANAPVMLTLGHATGIAGVAVAQQADTYNMQGVKVGKTSQKGIYIKGGNKVVIK